MSDLIILNLHPRAMRTAPTPLAPEVETAQKDGRVYSAMKGAYGAAASAVSAIWNAIANFFKKMFASAPKPLPVPITQPAPAPIEAPIAKKPLSPEQDLAMKLKAAAQEYAQKNNIAKMEKPVADEPRAYRASTITPEETKRRKVIAGDLAKAVMFRNVAAA